MSIGPCYYRWPCPRYLLCRLLWLTLVIPSFFAISNVHFSLALPIILFNETYHFYSGLILPVWVLHCLLIAWLFTIATEFICIDYCFYFWWLWSVTTWHYHQWRWHKYIFVLFSSHCKKGKSMQRWYIFALIFTLFMVLCSRSFRVILIIIFDSLYVRGFAHQLAYLYFLYVRGSSACILFPVL